MLDTLTSENYGDFNRRYVETFGWLVKDGQRRFVYINASDRYVVQFSVGGEFKYSATVDSGVMFEFIPVDKGWYTSVDGKLYYFERIPARQFRRGISAHNTKLYLMDKKVFRSQVLEYKTLKNIFENDRPYQYIPGMDSALSKFFAINQQGDVFFNDVLVGKTTDGVIKLSHNAVYQELSDLIKRNNYPLQLQ